jgi:hypothetical protein
LEGDGDHLKLAFDAFASEALHLDGHFAGFVACDLGRLLEAFAERGGRAQTGEALLGEALGSEFVEARILDKLGVEGVPLLEFASAELAVGAVGGEDDLGGVGLGGDLSSDEPASDGQDARGAGEKEEGGSGTASGFLALLLAVGGFDGAFGGEDVLAEREDLLALFVAFTKGVADAADFLGFVASELASEFDAAHPNGVSGSGGGFGLGCGLGLAGGASLLGESFGFRGFGPEAFAELIEDGFEFLGVSLVLFELAAEVIDDEAGVAEFLERSGEA